MCGQKGGEEMSDAGALIFVVGLFAVFGGWGGYLKVRHGGSAIAGTAGFVMIFLGAIMMSLG